MYARDLQAPAQAISDARDSLDGKTDFDQGIGTAEAANLVPADANALAFSRTPAGPGHCLPDRGTEDSGGFSPKASTEKSTGAAANKRAIVAGPDPLQGLLGRIGRGDAEAFRDLYSRTARRLFGLASKVVQRPELAEEVVQEVFVQVWSSAGRMIPPVAPPWCGCSH